MGVRVGVNVCVGEFVIVGCGVFVDDSVGDCVGLDSWVMEVSVEATLVATGSEGPATSAVRDAETLVATDTSDGD